MGEHELQAALRRKAEAAVRQAWQAAEARVAARRAELAAEHVALRAALEEQQALAAAAVRRSVLAAADATLRQRRLAAESALGERLRQAALRLLAASRSERRQALWRALAGELPPADWRRVRVHPDDLDLARQTFPSAEVTGEVELVGGLVAESADGRIVIDNSLAGRLERLWPELQAPLLAAVNEEVSRRAAGSATAG